MDVVLWRSKAGVKRLFFPIQVLDGAVVTAQLDNYRGNGECVMAEGGLGE